MWIQERLKMYCVEMRLRVSVIFGVFLDWPDIIEDLSNDF
jgi:hypothetical protein